MAGLGELDNLARRKAGHVRAPRCARGNRSTNRERGNQVRFHDMTHAALEWARLRIRPSTQVCAQAAKNRRPRARKRRHRCHRFPRSDVSGRREFVAGQGEILLKVAENTRQRQHELVPWAFNPSAPFGTAPNAHAIRPVPTHMQKVLHAGDYGVICPMISSRLDVCIFRPGRTARPRACGTS